MERGEQAALGIAAAGHVLLFALLSAGFATAPKPFDPPPAMSISLVDDVALTATAPAAIEPPAQSVAPDPGLPEDAAPPAPAPPEPAPPEPAPAPPTPAKPAPPKPAPPKPAPPKPAPARPAVTAPTRPVAAVPKAAPARPAPPRPAVPAPAKPATRSATRGTGTQVASTQVRPRGAILGNDFLKGLTADRAPPQARGQIPVAATMSSQAAADIGSAIKRQVQPCAERQQLNAPGAERISVDLRLNINRDGSLAGRPAVVGHTGIDDANSRYVDRVDDLAIAAFVGCAPLRGLPADLYDVPRGWKVFRLRFNLPR